MVANGGSLSCAWATCEACGDLCFGKWHSGWVCRPDNVTETPLSSRKASSLILTKTHISGRVTAEERPSPCGLGLWVRPRQTCTQPRGCAGMHRHVLCTWTASRLWRRASATGHLS